ncbi:MAG: hypothetical protein AAF441_11805 [Pseudomonadota bacterium]
MKTDTLREIIACLPTGRTLFSYYKDRYAVQLLEYVVPREPRIQRLRKSPHAKLLCRPPVRPILSDCGSGCLNLDDFLYVQSSDVQHYRLTLGTWGRESFSGWRRSNFQTTRRGCNLVLQLNFSGLHDAYYNKLIGADLRCPFANYRHPVQRSRWHTMSWARLDLDLETGEALVEEIQTDWLRRSANVLKRARRLAYGPGGARPMARMRLSGKRRRALDVCRYVEDAVKPHTRIWDEATLSATIWFLKEELGLHQIYMHEHRTGLALKSVTHGAPPRSLYTRLPQQFCFEKVGRGPEFLMRKNTGRLQRRAGGGPLAFWRLNV